MIRYLKDIGIMGGFFIKSLVLMVNGCVERSVIMCVAGGGEMTIEEAYDRFIMELTENAMRKQRYEDEECRECKERLYELTDEVHAYIQTCSVEIRELFQTYNEVRNEEESRHCSYLYVQGIRDCFKFLKFLEIL